MNTRSFSIAIVALLFATAAPANAQINPRAAYPELASHANRMCYQSSVLDQFIHQQFSCSRSYDLIATKSRSLVIATKRLKEFAIVGARPAAVETQLARIANCRTALKRMILQVERRAELGLDRIHGCTGRIHRKLAAMCRTNELAIDSLIRPTPVVAAPLPICPNVPQVPTVTRVVVKKVGLPVRTGFSFTINR